MDGVEERKEQMKVCRITKNINSLRINQTHSLGAVGALLAQWPSGGVCG